ncbi:MAG: APC family permease [Bdellovibrionales bacterium]|nr:APC family permease [Bdellovibrionales bacterium]
MGAHKGSGLNWVIAAGIVGADIGTSVFYGTGILFPIVGYLAPIFVILVCLMMWLFKSTYEEGLALSPYNGGAYSMILRSVGRRAAVLAGALTFVTYLATAAVSSLSGGFYLSSLFENGLSNSVVVLLSFIPIILFGLLNTRGIKEPAKIVTAIAAFHFFLLIIMVIWGFLYFALYYNEIDFSKLDNLTPSGTLTLPMLMYGFAAAFLGISGFESAAQIVEELEQPILKTVRMLYKTVVILVSVTAPFISILCLLLLSQDEVNHNLDYLLSGLANKLGGKVLLTVVVIDATLTLFAATNTAYVGFIGLATTMAKQGNLPSFFLKRIAHKYPTIQGYPLIALPFMVVAMGMSATVAGEIDIAAKVYEVAFLGVMVSFAVGVVLMRNRDMRRDTPNQYLSKNLIKIKDRIIPVPPFISGLVLSFAVLVLLFHANTDSLLMLVSLIASTLLMMAYYRWGELESRLESRHDLRLGLGRFSTSIDLPEDLPKFVLCAGGTGARRLINKALHHLLNNKTGPFELVIFHAEEGKDNEGFFYELLQRVVSQQIAPVYSTEDFILTVKILPGSLAEGLQTLKKTINFQTLLFGSGRDPQAAKNIAEEITHELDVKIAFLE